MSESFFTVQDDKVTSFDFEGLFMESFRSIYPEIIGADQRKQPAVVGSDASRFKDLTPSELLEIGSSYPGHNARITTAVACLKTIGGDLTIKLAQDEITPQMTHSFIEFADRVLQKTKEIEGLENKMKDQDYETSYFSQTHFKLAGKTVTIDWFHDRFQSLSVCSTQDAQKTAAYNNVRSRVDKLIRVLGVEVE